MRVLAVSQLFPNVREPTEAPFNRQQLTALGQLCELEMLATIPWFPGARYLSRYSRAGRLLDVPHQEAIDGLRVQHPRYLNLPALSRWLSAATYAASLFPLVRRYRGWMDLLLATWAYPDGCAAVALGQLLRVPVVVKVHGSDLNVLPRMAGPRWQMRWALPRAARVLPVTRPLGDRATELGVRPERVIVLPNGVDTSVFCPSDRGRARTSLGRRTDEKLIVFVGLLDTIKGVTDLLDAFSAAAAKDASLALVLVGDGPRRGEYQTRVASLGQRVLFTGALPLAQVAEWMAAANIVVLPSHNEGSPNVLLEALASGRRVVATRVGGVPEIVDRGLLGELVPARDPARLAEALLREVHVPYDPDEVAAVGSRGSWHDSAARLLDILERVVARHRVGRA